MPANTIPIVPLTPKTYSVKTPANANSNYLQTPTGGNSTVDGTAAGTNGSRIDCVKFCLSATSSTGGKVQIWHKSGSTYTFIDELTYPITTISATALTAMVVWRPPAGYKFLLSGDLLAFSCSQTDVFTVHVDQSDY